MVFSYDHDKLFELIKNFHIITGIKIVVFDHEMKKIAAYPAEECPFCAAMSKTPTTCQKCHDSTVEGCLLSKKLSSPNIYKCHAGLIEAVTPIRIDDVIVGYMMLGQVLDKEDKETLSDEIIRYASEYVGEDANLHFSNLICKSHDEIMATANIMKSCVCDILMNHIIKEGGGKTAFEITRYIEEHLPEDLSVSVLCRKFNISRNTLYRIADTYLGLTVANYIKKKRIEKAEELLKEGMSVTKVADLLGFCDYGYFGKVFKSVTGKTPTDIKKSR